MKKTMIVIAAVCIFSFPIIACALPILNDDGTDGFEDIGGTPYSYYVNSGELMYFEDINNEGINFNDGTIEGLVEDWLINEGIIAPTDTETFNLTATTVNYNLWGDGSSGTWSVNPVGDVINFYAVKGNTGHAMYYVSPAEGTGSWSTFDVFQGTGHKGDVLEISHFTGYNQQPIPEPATMLLFGTGLAGLIGISSRRKRK